LNKSNYLKRRDMNVCILLPKSPLPKKGRIGPEEKQDWYKSLVAAAGVGSDIIILPCSVERGGIKESDYYIDHIRRFTDTKIVVLGGMETVRQLYEARRWLLTRKVDSVVICVSFLHFLRVWYLTTLQKWPNKITFKVTGGYPRPREVFYDLILSLLFPVIIIGGGLRTYLRKVIKRRRKGKI
jgi:hypothetical protein